MTLGKQYTLTDEQVAFYQEQGYLHLPGVLTREEANSLREEAHALIHRLAKTRGGESAVQAQWGSAKLVSELPTTLLHCHNVQFHSAAFTRLICDPRLTDRIADLIGPNIQLHHTKLFIKPPERGAPFPMHQDYPYFPHEKHTMLAAIFFFDDAPPEKGCLLVMPGSHKLGPIPHDPEGGWHLPIAQYPLESATPVPAQAGDVVVFNYLTIHGSGVNTSSEARTTLLVQMRDPTDHPTVATHLSRGQGMMLRGIDPEADADPSTDSASRFLRRLNNPA
ncbi:MAG: phytanoyl-CoA dioxygenase [Armatimonadetes bacterium JP3_11]|nr:MAG: phytanoyl-CoA dioxygenase [Armatimonadetes bacterium CP1_7O]OYT75936.1 MAG: phytanoyl-CoA dioxygenase [Armatimonadetes bacterium JP3_11]RMH09053.1 MAG: phytanoyl-CoA dioxygenase family protein [Armatimonadota bacterium]